MSAFWVNKVKKMKVGNPLSKAVLLYLADCTTDKGCFPSQELISHDLEMSIDSVRRHIRHLEQIGVLVKSQRQAGNRVLKSEYSIVDGSREQPLDGSTQLVSDGSSLMVSHSKDAESKHAESRVDGSREQPSHNKEVLTTNNDNNNTSYSTEVLDVFEFYKTHLGHPKARLTPDKKNKITARLREGYTPDDLKDVIRGCKLSPHHQGQNTAKTVYDGIDLLFRNGSKVEQFIGYFNQYAPKERELTEMDKRHIAAEEEYQRERVASALRPKVQKDVPVDIFGFPTLTEYLEASRS